MHQGIMPIALCVFAAGAAGSLGAQNGGVCECGKHPPAPPRDRIVAPYAGEPQDLRPYANFEKPYYENYLEPNIYVGSGRDIPDPKDINEVRIGFLGPLDPSPDKADGEHMLHGAQLAVEEANARGGYGGKPFKLMVHNDYNNWPPNRRGDLGLGRGRSGQNDLRRSGLGDLRLDQFGVDSYYAARCS